MSKWSLQHNLLNWNISDLEKKHCISFSHFHKITPYSSSCNTIILLNFSFFFDIFKTFSLRCESEPKKRNEEWIDSKKPGNKWQCVLVCMYGWLCIDVSKWTEVSVHWLFSHLHAFPSSPLFCVRVTEMDICAWDFPFCHIQIQIQIQFRTEICFCLALYY